MNYEDTSNVKVEKDVDARIKGSFEFRSFSGLVLSLAPREERHQLQKDRMLSAVMHSEFEEFGLPKFKSFEIFDFDLFFLVGLQHVVT